MLLFGSFWNISKYWFGLKVLGYAKKNARVRQLIKGEWMSQRTQELPFIQWKISLSLVVRFILFLWNACSCHATNDRCKAEWLDVLTSLVKDCLPLALQEMGDQSNWQSLKWDTGVVMVCSLWSKYKLVGQIVVDYFLNLYNHLKSGGFCCK